MKISFDPLELMEKGATLKQILDSVEKKILLELVEKFQWNMTRLALECLCTRQALLAKMKKHGIKNLKKERRRALIASFYPQGRTKIAPLESEVYLYLSQTPPQRSEKGAISLSTLFEVCKHPRALDRMLKQFRGENNLIEEEPSPSDPASASPSSE